MTGRRMPLNLSMKDSEGEIIIPSALTSSETSLIAATLETIERIGPCQAEIKLLKVEDAMEDKRQFVMDKAKEILKGLMQTSATGTEEIGEQLKESVRTEEITAYKGIPSGPGLEEADNIIIVEGRADVIKLLKLGIKNVIAVEGTSVPKEVAELSKGKETTVLVDGDRGGDLIIRELLQVANVNFIARAPIGREVEECTEKEIFKSLRDKVPVKEFRPISNNGDREEKTFVSRRPSGRYERPSRPYRTLRLKVEQKELFKKTLEDIVGTRAAFIFNQKSELLGRVPLNELLNTIRVIEDPYAIVVDGKIDHEVESIARKKNTIKFLVGREKETLSSPITIVSKEDLQDEKATKS